MNPILILLSTKNTHVYLVWIVLCQSIIDLNVSVMFASIRSIDLLNEYFKAVTSELVADSFLCD